MSYDMLLRSIAYFVSVGASVEIIVILIKRHGWGIMKAIRPSSMLLWLIALDGARAVHLLALNLSVAIQCVCETQVRAAGWLFTWPTTIVLVVIAFYIRQAREQKGDTT